MGMPDSSMANHTGSVVWKFVAKENTVRFFLGWFLWA